MIKLLLISLLTVCGFICIVTIIGGVICIITLKKVVSMKNTLIKTNQHNPSETELNLAKQYINYMGRERHTEFHTIMKALDRLTPKKPDLEGDGYDDNGNLIYDTYICPNCEAHYETDYDIHDHCPKCGQAFDRSDIDWSEEDNEE